MQQPDERDDVDSGGHGLLGRFSRRQLQVAGAALVALVVVIILAVVILGRHGGTPSGDEIDRRLKEEIVTGVDDARGGGLDLPRLKDRLERASGGWVVSLAATNDNRTVGVAARQPDGPDCLFVWSAVGGAKSALVTDPNLPCVGDIAVIAAGR